MSKITESSQNNNLIVEWTFRYTEEVIPAGKRKARPQETEGKATVEIPSVSDKEAPVAIIEVETLGEGEESESTERKYRLFNGKLWYEKKFNENGLREDALEPVKEEMEEKRYPYLDKESHMKKITEWADNLLLVNGVAHCPLPGEPRIFIELECSEGIRISIERCFDYYRKEIRKCDYYAVDKLDEVIKESQRIGKLQKDFDPNERIDLECRFSFEVLISSALTVDYKADHEAELNERFKSKLKRISNELNSVFCNPEERLKAVEVLRRELELQIARERA